MKGSPTVVGTGEASDITDVGLIDAMEGLLTSCVGVSAGALTGRGA